MLGIYHKFLLVQVLVPIANGSEEMETISIVDVLRRAKAEVIVASVEDTKETVGSRKVRIVADMLLNEASKLSYDLIVLPVSKVPVLHDSGFVDACVDVENL